MAAKREEKSIRKSKASGRALRLWDAQMDPEASEVLDYTQFDWVDEVVADLRRDGLLEGRRIA